MNTMFVSSIFRQFKRGLNPNTRYIYKLSPFAAQQVYFCTSSVHLSHPRISSIPESTHNALRRQYQLSDDYFVMYKEPKKELNHMIILKCSELFLYSSPLLGLGYIYLLNKSIESYTTSQEDFFIGIAIICVYLLGIRFCVNGFVKVMFYNPSKDVYRAYVLNKYKPTYKFVEFKAEDLKVINLSPSIPMARNFFKVGKQTLILHDQLFATYNDQEKLIGGAIEKWHAKWEK